MRKMIWLVLVLALMLQLTGAVAETDDWTNILLLGGDARSQESFLRTDSMMVLSINQTDMQVKFTSIMRDTLVHIPGYGMCKINAANVYGGPELAMKIVNENFGLSIDQYLIVNMTDMIDIIDLLGGVDIELSASEVKYANYYARDYLRHFPGYSGETTVSEAGLNHLNGLLAMSYTRNRYSDSDYGRVMRQQNVLLKLLEKAQDMELADLMALSDQILENIDSNMDDEQLKALATASMVVEPEDVSQFRVPADGSFNSGMKDGVWSIRPNFEKNKTLLHDFIYGEE